MRDAGLRLKDVVRFSSYIGKVYRGDGCWLWQGKKTYGYGYIQVAGKFWRTHRLAYVLDKGPIPDGLVIDHLCRNPSCVNPDHLEAVTQATNVSRAIFPDRKERTYPLTKHCSRGHEYTHENTRWTVQKGKYQVRICRTCQYERNREYNKTRRKK